jgi:type 1 fimbria pilin
MGSNRFGILVCSGIAASMFLFSNRAFALYADCSAPLPTSVTLPSVSVPGNLQIGQAIPGAKAAFSIPITCTNTFNESARWYWAATTMTLVPGFTDVYSISGMGAGIGFRIRDKNGALILPVSYKSTNASLIFDVAVTGVGTISGSFELVRTASVVTPGTFAFGGFVTVPSTEYANGGNAPKSTLNFGYTMNAVTVAACAVVKSDIAVSMQNVHVSELPAPGATAYPTNFGIDLKCESDAKPQITLTDAATPFNQTTELTLAPGSTASGIAIQILYNDTLVRFGPAPVYYSGSGPAIVNALDLGTVSGTIHLPFTGRYLRTGNIMPGKIIGRATFTFTYQ